ncbi:glycoside hydrolase family 88 protein [Sediminibacterium soli]|uniref:glycoside hydrolase family 88 protein n=1 Tax=Sediminibacterium soli TaxID=2698829 RepID=UPI00137A3253|nr:glycoside hydrolase family 88 protein [Sediminibacterium soli]NCI47366.1 glycoside hydrolase family 88 protein [Sediminibacterium soli]
MKKQLTLFLLLAVLFAATAFSQTPAEKMAATVMTIWKDSLSMDPARPSRWSYDQGVILKGIQGLWLHTADPKYFNYMQKSMDHFVNDKGEIRTYKQVDYNIDNLLCGEVLLSLYNVTGKEKYYRAATTLREQLKTQPRTNQGSFWHKKIYPYQVWLDGLYMGQPFYTQYAVLFHEDDATFNDIGKQFVWIEQHARDAKTGLLYHGWDESRQQKWADPKTGLSPHIWARAMGWFGNAMADVLENFPAANPYRDSIAGILNRFAAAVKKAQQPNGLWYDIIDRPGAKGNYYEASASSMFVYALAKGVRLGYLPASYLDVARKGYAGIQKEFIETGANGLTNLKGTVSVSGLGGNPYRDGSYEYYMSEKVVVNDPKGVGAFLQAANEMELLRTLPVGKGKTVVLDDYFNAERKKDITGATVAWHYKWNEMSNGGFSLLGDVFRSYGVQTKTLSAAPDAANLKKADIYIIVDADNATENPAPNYVQAKDVNEIYEWVKKGGVLVLMHNDKGNAEFAHFNTLSEKFGIHFNEDSYNRVPNNDFNLGKVDIPAGNKILPATRKIYQKEISSMVLKEPATAYLKKDELVIFAVAKIGRGTVFATADPWIYNEYTDGRKLPADYENFKAANELVQWLIRQTPSRAK